MASRVRRDDRDLGAAMVTRTRLAIADGASARFHEKPSFV
jgi:hypothetical protein